MNTPCRNAENRWPLRLERRVEKVVNVAVADMDPLFVDTEKGINPPFHLQTVRQNLTTVPVTRVAATEDGRVAVFGKPKLVLWVFSPLQLVNVYLETTMDYRSYRLASLFPPQDNDVARQYRWKTEANRSPAQVLNIWWFRPEFVSSFLPAFKVVCDTNGIHEGVTMWLLLIFMEKPAAATLSSRTCLESSRPSRQKWKLISYSQLVNYFLNTYAPDAIFPKADAHIINFMRLKAIKPPNTLATLEKDLMLWLFIWVVPTKTYFIEGLRTSICQRIRNYWTRN